MNTHIETHNQGIEIVIKILFGLFLEKYGRESEDTVIQGPQGGQTL
jgi:hypothetical protein